MRLFDQIPIRVRISFGLVVLMASTLLLARPVSTLIMPAELSFFADGRHETMVGRKQLCESLAIATTAIVSKGTVDDLETTLNAIMSRQDQVVSIGFRRFTGELLVDVGSHTQKWKANPGSTIDQIKVPVFKDGEVWASLEVAFVPSGGLLGSLWGPLWLLCFMVPICGIQFSFFLRRTLDQLDPSKAIPGHVREVLDRFAEGLLVIDSRQRILFANQPLADALNTDADALRGVYMQELPWILPEHGPHDLPWVVAANSGKSVSDRMVQTNIDDRRLLL